MNFIISQLAAEIETSLEEAGYKSLIPDVAAELAKRSEKIAKTRVISAVEITSEQKQKLAEKLQTDQVEYLIDQSIIGGLIIEHLGQRQDLSLKKRLNLIKNTITK